MPARPSARRSLPSHLQRPGDLHATATCGEPGDGLEAECGQWVATTAALLNEESSLDAAHPRYTFQGRTSQVRVVGTSQTRRRVALFPSTTPDRASRSAILEAALRRRFAADLAEPWCRTFASQSNMTWCDSFIAPSWQWPSRAISSAVRIAGSPRSRGASNRRPGRPRRAKRRPYSSGALREGGTCMACRSPRST